MIYKSHQITRSQTVHAPTLRPLYKIEGRYSKDAMRRPFITSIADAKAWINEQIVADEMAGR